MTILIYHTKHLKYMMVSMYYLHQRNVSCTREIKKKPHISGSPYGFIL